MRTMSRNSFLKLVFGGVMAAGQARSASAYNPRERLLVSLMAMRGGEILADEAETFRPHHQHNEQVMTLDVGEGAQRRTVLVNLWDRDAGGVAVMCCIIGADGRQIDRRDFIMYPFIDIAAVRHETLRFPVLLAADDVPGAAHVMDAIELTITMKRAERRL